MKRKRREIEILERKALEEATERRKETTRAICDDSLSYSTRETQIMELLETIDELKEKVNVLKEEVGAKEGKIQMLQDELNIINYDG